MLGRGRSLRSAEAFRLVCDGGTWSLGMNYTAEEVPDENDYVLLALLGIQGFELDFLAVLVLDLELAGLFKYLYIG